MQVTSYNSGISLVEGTVEGSHAKPEVSSDPNGFGGKLKELETASAAMIDAAGTDLVALKAAMSGAGGACKACHENTEVPRTDQRCGDLFGCTASTHMRSEDVRELFCLCSDLARVRRSQPST